MPPTRSRGRGRRATNVAGAAGQPSSKRRGRPRTKSANSNTRVRSQRQSATTANVIEIIDDNHPSSSLQTNQANSRRNMGTQNRNRSRPVVVSLDVTYSSESDFEDDLENSDKETSENQASPSPSEKKDTNVPVVIQRASIDYSDSSDEDNASSNEDNATTITQPASNGAVSDCSDSSEDLYAIDHQATRLAVLKSQMEELKKIEMKKKAERKAKKMIKLQNTSLSSTTPEVSDSPNHLPQSEDPNSTMEQDDSFVDIDVSDVVLKGNSNPRVNKKTRLGLERLVAHSNMMKQKMQMNESLNDEIEIDSDEESISKLSLKIRWGTDYLKVPIKKSERFACIYRHFADLHGVSLNNVVLNYNDLVISPDSTPDDLGLTVADIIDGGIINKLDRSACKDIENDGDVITLKVQNSNRRAQLTELKINIYDKMSVLMEKYAENKNLSLDNLKFRFDGENLNPNECPLDLDLEGGECIDVFEL